jgi:hypothetical protein
VFWIFLREALAQQQDENAIIQMVCPGKKISFSRDTEEAHLCRVSMIKGYRYGPKYTTLNLKDLADVSKEEAIMAYQARKMGLCRSSYFEPPPPLLLSAQSSHEVLDPLGCLDLPLAVQLLLQNHQNGHSI